MYYSDTQLAAADLALKTLLHLESYKRHEMFWSLVDDANKITPIIKADYAVAGAIGGWLATLLFS